jgi:hypothetical protein
VKAELFADSPNREVPKYLGAGTQFLVEGHDGCIRGRASAC